MELIKQLRNAAKAQPINAALFNEAADEMERLQGDENKLRTNAVLEYLSSTEIPEYAKGKMIGEFSIYHTVTCSGCYYDEPDEGCEVCGGEVDYEVPIDVPWTMQKDIFQVFIQCAKDEYAKKLERDEL